MEDSIAGFKAILAGEYDHYSEAAFFMVGGIDEVKAKAEKMAADTKQSQAVESGTAKGSGGITWDEVLTKAIEQRARVEELLIANDPASKDKVLAETKQWRSDAEAEVAQLKIDEVKAQKAKQERAAAAAALEAKQNA